MIRRSTGPIALALILLLAIIGLTGAVLAAQPQPQPSQQNEFVPVKDLPHQEQLPAAPLVTAAYAFVWVALLVYVWSVWRRVGAVQRELADLRRRTERKA
jgi:CcmD family protein